MIEDTGSIIPTVKHHANSCNGTGLIARANAPFPGVGPVTTWLKPTPTDLLRAPHAHDGMPFLTNVFTADNPQSYFSSMPGPSPS